MKDFIYFILLFFTLQAQAQVVTTDPKFPRVDASVDIIFDASLSSGGLADYTGDDIYAHTGVTVEGVGDWQNAPSWGDNAPKYKLTSLGNKKWKLSITPSIKAYYNVADGQKVTKMSFVFRNGDASKEGKDNGKDIFVDVYQSDLSISFETPKAIQVLDKNTALPIIANSSDEANLQLLLNETVISTANAASRISYTYTFSQPGNYWLIAEASKAGMITRDSVPVNIAKDQSVLPLPANTRAGINYVNDNTVTFVLYAPKKKHVFLLGDFNNWETKNDYMLNKAGDYWWITVSNLEKGKEYAFQYLVDGQVKIADPYTDKILDPWNDQYISSTAYPNLKPYPQGKTTGIVSVVQTGQSSYTWSAANYKTPAKDKLVTYELLVRDFTADHTFTSTLQKLDYLQSLGINAIELMPINEFEGNSSWGYNPSFYFAVDKYYGTKDAYKAFVDECHKRGIAIIMDMVLNHSYGQSPLVQLYWDGVNNRPAVDNPWYNVTSPNQAYSWGYDFNHESQQTKALTDSICSYWMKEYRVDGFRFDFTKGFTNTPGDGWAYDQSRINILTRMANEIYKRKSDALVIFEHLTDNSEETVLADNADVMLWGNMNNNYCEAVMGYTEDKKTDMSWALYSKRGWTKPNLVSYMESHDEERMTYKSITWGKDKSLATGLKRDGLAAAFYLTLPGPKMIWQFGELGYDYSINTCSDGVTESGDCRVAEKPIRWDYYDQAERKGLHDIYAKLIKLKKEQAVFESKDMQYALEDAQKYIVWKSPDMNAFLVGNFGDLSADVSVTIPAKGKWYEAFSETMVDIASTAYTVNLQPGEYKLFVDKNIFNIPIEGDSTIPLRVMGDVISYTGTGVVKTMMVYDLNGRLINRNQNQQSISLSTIPPKSVYLIKVETDKEIIKEKFKK